MTVPNEGDERLELAQRMIHEGWSMIRVNQELLLKFGRRRDGGKDHRLPKQKKGMLSQLDRMALNRIRWLKQVKKEEEGESPPLQSLPDDIREHLKQLEPVVETLQTMVAKALDHESKKAKRS